MYCCTAVASDVLRVNAMGRRGLMRCACCRGGTRGIYDWDGARASHKTNKWSVKVNRRMIPVEAALHSVSNVHGTLALTFFCRLLERTRYFIGETTVGRTAEQDITIADPSVSGTHATIDVVDLAEAGGKRFTLKVRILATQRHFQHAGEGYRFVSTDCSYHSYSD